MLFAIPRSQRQQRRNIADGRLNVGFHKVLGITIRRQPDKGVALLMLYKVGINTQQHFGITDTGRLHHIHLTDVVAAHRIHDGPLKGQCFPAPFLVCGFFREIVISIRPFNGGLWLRPEQGTKPGADKMPQPVNLTVRYIHSATPVSVHPARLLCSWL